MSPFGRAVLGAGLLLLVGCGPAPAASDAGADAATVDAGTVDMDAGTPPDAGPDAGGVDAGRPVDPWADRVVRFVPGEGAGFGQDRFPDVVLGPPSGGGASSGSLDVLSLGREGVIDLEFMDVIAIDGPGVDFLVFENPFVGFYETGVVSVSEDGLTWYDFPCDADDADAGFPGCAGTHVVFANPAQGISGVDPQVAGGDGYDLADVGLTRARFVRVKDSGKNRFYAPPSGGFDLDAVAVVNGVLADGGTP